MRFSRSSVCSRALALLALSALLFVVLGSTVGLAADPEAGGEPCVGCTGCDTGECEGQCDDPLASHHHCCTTCCMSHAQLAPSDVPDSRAPLAMERLQAAAAVSRLPVCPDTPYHPPRI